MWYSTHMKAKTTRIIHTIFGLTIPVGTEVEITHIGGRYSSCTGIGVDQLWNDEYELLPEPKPEPKPEPICCPECLGLLIHERTDDGIIQHRIRLDGTKEELANKSNGFDLVYCSENQSHKLPPALVEKVLDIVSS